MAILESLEKEFNNIYTGTINDNNHHAKDDDKSASKLVEKEIVNSNEKITNLQKCLLETKEFKLQLKKLRAHLNKNIQDFESLNDLNDTIDKGHADTNNNIANDTITTNSYDDTSFDSSKTSSATTTSSSKHLQDREKLEKKNILIKEKINKSYKQWDHLMKKNSKSTLQQYTKFNKNSLQQLKKIFFNDIYKNKINDDKKHLIDKAIGFYITRYNIGNIPIENNNDIVKYLNDVYNIDSDISNVFLNMGQIIHDLRNHNYQTCIHWYEQHENVSSNSTLKIELYILTALNLVKSNQQDSKDKGNRNSYNYVDVGNYLYENIPKELSFDLNLNYSQLVTNLMSKISIGAKIDGIDNIINERLESCIEIFISEFCNSNNLTFDSPLFLIVLSGIISFQYFIKYDQIKQFSHVGWTTKNELPFDVELPEFLSYFHPIFICPVLKEETTEENPPYSLACHHIISKKALDKLSKNGSLSFKCPYCPIHTTMIKTKRVNFVML